jgi:hypothetical protein
MFGLLHDRRLKKRADRLVSISKIVCTASTTNVLDRLPVVDRYLRDQGAEGFRRLDLAFTVACVGVGLMTANVTSKDAPDFYLQVAGALHRWRAEAPELLVDFDERVLKPSRDSKDAVEPLGFWVLSQLGLTDSSAISRGDIAAVGTVVVQSMASWE